MSITVQILLTRRAFLFSSQIHNIGYRRISTTMPTMKELEQMVRVEPVSFDLSCGEKISLDSHIQDTLPKGSDVGTVVCMHGSPGSHKDFKYITPLLHDKGIRVIGINFPDYGLTEGHEKLRFDNIERNNYVKAVVEKVGLKDHFVIMGHSRGCENATGSAALLSDKVTGLILLNPTGLRLHRGLRPFWVVTFILWLHSLGTIIRTTTENLLHWFYNAIGLRLEHGKRAVTCVRTMSNIELSKLGPKIDVINNSNMKVLQAYSGKDKFIETPISEELALQWHNRQDVVCNEKNPECAESATIETINYFKTGTKSVTVYFPKESHFLNKHQAKFVADTIECILKV